MAGLMFVAVTNFVLAVPTAAANALVIVAILTTSSLRTPSYLLLTSLAFSDLAVGLFCQPGIAALVITGLKDGLTAFAEYMIGIITYISIPLVFVSLLTVTAISVDRYLAIRLKMRYRSVVTVRRVRGICVAFWIGSTLGFIMTIFLHDLYLFPILSITIVSLCFVLILVFYTMSFRALKIHCAQTQPQGNQQQQPNSTTQSNAIDVLKYRKLLNTMILIVVVIVICYIPLLAIFLIYLNPEGSLITDDTPFIIWVLGSITFLNSTLNPVIYLTRLKDIRHACIQKLRKLFRRENSTIGQ